MLQDVFIYKGIIKIMSKPKGTITPKETKSFLLDKVPQEPPRNLLHYILNPWQSSCEITGLTAGSDAWKASRKLAITGSDLVVLAGESSTITPLGLYERKLGIVEDNETSRQMEYGLHLEPLLLKWVQQDYPAHKIESMTLHLASNYNPLHQCTTDGVFWIDGTQPVPLELKTAIGIGADEWEGDDIPAKYNIQIQWQLYITGSPGAYICCLPAGNTYRLITKSVMADLALQQRLVKLADRFLINLQKRIAPAAVEADLKGLLGKMQDKLMQPDAEFISYYNRIEGLDAKEAKDLKARMAQIMGEHDRVEFEQGGKLITVYRKEVKVKEKVVPASSYFKLSFASKDVM